MTVPAEDILERVTVTATGCWEWSKSRTVAGYGQLRRSGEYTVLAHRLAYEAFVGPIPAGLQICHRCDNPPCCNPEHLFAGTQKANMQDMIAKGRDRHPDQSGEHNGRAVLSDEEVAQIVAHRGWLSSPHLAEMFGVCQSHICNLQLKAKRASPMRSESRRAIRGAMTISKRGDTRYPRGERRPNAKLRASDAAAIRAHAGWLTQAHLASMFGVSRKVICDVQAGRTWCEPAKSTILFADTEVG